jgi:hypothetical protein
MKINPQNAFALGFVIVLIKFLAAGLTIGDLHFPAFTGSEFAIVMGALGSIHSLSKHVENLGNKQPKAAVKSDEPKS